MVRATNVRAFREHWEKHRTGINSESFFSDFGSVFAGLQFEIETGEILESDGRTSIHGKMLLENLSSDENDFRIRFTLKPSKKPLRPKVVAMPVAQVIEGEVDETATEIEAQIAIDTDAPLSDEIIEGALRKLFELEARLPWVGLKYYRDNHLKDFRLFMALKDRNLLTFEKCANPAKKEFPVTTVKANRHHPLVKKIYGNSTGS